MLLYTGWARTREICTTLDRTSVAWCDRPPRAGVLALGAPTALAASVVELGVLTAPAASAVACDVAIPPAAPNQHCFPPSMPPVFRFQSGRACCRRSLLLNRVRSGNGIVSDVGNRDGGQIYRD